MEGEESSSDSGSSSDAPEEIPTVTKGRKKMDSVPNKTILKAPPQEESDSDDSSENNDNSEGEEEEDDEVSAVKKELANLPFEELQKLKNKLGMKVYNRAMRGGGDMPSNTRRKTYKRENKNRPQEMTSKRAVKRYREVVQVKKKIHRDPRFDDLSGEFSEEMFNKNYSFLSDVKTREKEKLLKRMKTEKDEEKKSEIKFLVKKIDQQEKLDKQKQKRQEIEKEKKKKEKEMILQGKNPYFLKKSDKKKLELAEKFKDLKKSGKLDNYLAKKRKKTASKDRKHIPNRHFRAGAEQS